MSWAGGGMAVEFARNGDLEIAYEVVGGVGGRPLLLIQGSAPMLAWPDGFCRLLAERGFCVARFDNRDSGRSSRAVRNYTLAEMATDALAVLDELGWSAAHVAGVSMGGMIAQVLAVHHPDRVLSLTSISSAPDASMRWSWRMLKVVVGFMALSLRQPATPQAAGDQLVKQLRIIGSPGYPPDEEWIRSVGRRNFEHRTDAAAARRQAAATRASGDRRAELAHIRVPTLVVTGEADPVQPVRAGRATADAIPGARFVSYPGMGHDLPRELWPAITDEMRAIATTTPTDTG